MKEKMRHEKQRQAQKEYEESLGEPATAEEVRQIMAEARARIGG
jgi:hypothetical protein